MKNNILKKEKINLSPPSMLALSFAVCILLGTILLKLPITQNYDISWVEALFTTVSAVTITGLSVVNIGETFTMTGQLIILALMQIGGLGFMTFAILAVLSFSKKVALKQQLMAQDSLDQTSLAKVGFIAKGVFLYTLFFEFIGFSILTYIWSWYFPIKDAMYYALFYSVSAFNNAGFSLFSDSLVSTVYSPLLFMTISVLYMIGGLGFLVLMDIKRHKKWKRLSTNSKIILSGVLCLNVFAFLMIWLMEAKNPATLGAMSFGDQAIHAWFQATVPRSAGFNSIHTGEMMPSSSFLTMLLMFIGGGSLSTAGGIKVGTFVILCISTLSFLRRQDEVYIFKHAIPQNTILKALAVTLITCAMICIGMFLILIFEPKQNYLDLMFEVVSASCTVGLSRGITGDLSNPSLFILMILMFMGRLGPLTLAYLLATSRKSRIQHAEADVQIG
ncbi:TrkH family potassium uptake protein [Moraxella sp. ZY210820]|uniref:TrkH family potassium uptake protein n=1 Tax=unclassified Moraxella TaxID=2685852 RepID=UPI00273170E8|nr:potassium transporter TrkG [Moraxella sp. ZY210820]WLF84070.1 potassium transporter TrkH [Moraxella sp. ZY210820]